MLTLPSVYKDTLIVYYSDQRDPNYGQKLVHQETKDLVHWSDVIDDVVHDTYTDRPGMPVVTKLPNGKYFLVSETTSHDPKVLHTDLI